MIVDTIFVDNWVDTGVFAVQMAVQDLVDLVLFEKRRHLAVVE